jgi:ATP-binding cassette, subfamily B, bacterial
MSEGTAAGRRTDGLRAAWLIIALTFRADPLRAAWLVVRSPVNMCSVLGIAWGTKLLTDAAVSRDGTSVVKAAAVVVGIQLLGTLSSVGSLASRAMVVEKTSLLIDQQLMESALSVPGLGLHESPKHRDQLELLRLRRGELGEVVDSIAHNIGIVLLTFGSMTLLASIHPLMLLLPVAALPSLVCSPLAERMRVRSQEGAIETLRSATHVFELSTSAAAGKEVRLFGLGPLLERRHRALWDRADAVQNRAAWLGGALAAAGWVLFAGAYVGSIVLVVVLATPGDVLMTVQLAAGVNRLVMGMVFLAGWLYGQVRTAGRVVWLMNYAAESRRTAAGTAPAAPAPERLREGITFDHVSFRYPDTDVEVIRDLSLHVPPGTTLAVVGENGAGKSTLVKLLGGFYLPTSGRILVDGVDLRRIDPAEWRRRWAAGFQDFARFELLAGETVGVGDLARLDDEPAVLAALERASAVGVVQALPNGLGTPVGRSFEHGADLSGGQWQRLALGRAMMRETPLVLVLDEPTASLDAPTEHELFARYAATAERVAGGTGAVTVLVSHRFSTVRMADLVAVVDAGRLVESGSHEELLRSGGLYAELFELQARAYR